MEIKTRLSEKDFIDVNMTLLYRRPFTKIVVGFMVLCLALLLAISVIDHEPFSFDGILWPLIAVFGLPVITLIGAKLNYRSNQRIKETIEYTFENDFLRVKGESFSSQLTWEKIHKVTLTKKWLLIWQTRQMANVIPRRDIWEGDITALKEILDRHNVKNNL